MQAMTLSQLREIKSYYTVFAVPAEPCFSKQTHLDLQAHESSLMNMS